MTFKTLHRYGLYPHWAVVVVQLTAQSLPLPEDPGSNPVIGKKKMPETLVCPSCKSRFVRCLRPN